jgi:adenosine 3'-phospho 5'-phosphosulfate transporter B3
MGGPATKTGGAVFFGLDLPLKGASLFVFLTAGSIASGCGFAALQEDVWRIPGFSSASWLTFVTTFSFFLCATLEMILTGDTKRKGSLKNYLMLSVLTILGTYLTMKSLHYLSYVTRVLFKSSKLVPTMIAGTVMQGRRYSIMEYVAAGFLVLGISLFTLGDADAKGSFSWMGIPLIVGGVVADAATSNFEEKMFFRIESPASAAEVMCWSSLFGSLYALVLCFFQGELALAVQFSQLHPDFIPKALISSVCGYLSVIFVMNLIKQYGASVTEMAKSLRKVCTVVISFLIFPKTFCWQYLVGGIMVVISLVATQELQRRKGGDVKHEPAGPLLPIKEPLLVPPGSPTSSETASEQKVKLHAQRDVALAEAHQMVSPLLGYTFTGGWEVGSVVV